MSERTVIDLFVEDKAHEAFLKPLLHRIAREEAVAIQVRVRVARGGHGRAMDEFRNYQKVVEKGIGAEGYPDILVVGIDGNCTTFSRKRAEIVAKTGTTFTGRVVAACPDPHVERWYLADLDSFHAVVGCRPEVGRKKCVRDYYKRVLAGAVRKGGHPLTLGGIEFAAELAAKMDLYRAGRNDASLGAFINELRGMLRKIGKKPEA
jgi:hypothetical protein